MNTEDRIKQVFDSWDEQKSDLGFDKNLVWSKISVPDKSRLIIMYRIAVVVLVLMLAGNVIYSRYQHHKMKQEYVAKVGVVKTLGDEIKSLKREQKSTVPSSETKEKTIIKTVTREVPSRSILKENKELHEINQQLIKQLDSLQQELMGAKGTIFEYTDSLAIMAMSIENLKSKTSSNNNFSINDVKLKVNEEALQNLSKQSETELKSTNSDKQKIKLVLFNNSRLSDKKAPFNQGLSFK